MLRRFEGPCGQNGQGGEALIGSFSQLHFYKTMDDIFKTLFSFFIFSHLTFSEFLKVTTPSMQGPPPRFLPPSPPPGDQIPTLPTDEEEDSQYETPDRNSNNRISRSTTSGNDGEQLSTNFGLAPILKTAIVSFSTIAQEGKKLLSLKSLLHWAI